MLDSRTVSSFQNGEYLVWNVSGSVTLRVTNLNSATSAVVSGLFLGGPVGSTVATTANVGSNPVTGTSSLLNVLGADSNYPASALTYTWAATSVPSGAVTPHSASTARTPPRTPLPASPRSGNDTFLVTITDPGGLFITSSVIFTVAQTLTTIRVAPNVGIAEFFR